MIIPNNKILRKVYLQRRFLVAVGKVEHTVGNNYKPKEGENHIKLSCPCAWATQDALILFHPNSTLEYCAYF